MSITRPGPISRDHQPGLPVTGWALAANWSAVSGWQTRTALSRAAVKAP